MAETYKTIKFQGQDFILVGGAITTPESFLAGEVSYAHLHKNGQIARFGEIIGSSEDIEYTGEIDLSPGIEGVLGMLTSPTWMRSWFQPNTRRKPNG